MKTRRFTPTALAALSFIAALVWLLLFGGGLFENLLTEPAAGTQSLSRVASAHPPPGPFTLTVNIVGDAAQITRTDVDPDVAYECVPGGQNDFPLQLQVAGCTTVILAATSVYEGWSFMRWEWHDPYNDLMTSVDPNLPVTLLDENATRTAVFMRGHVEVYNGQGGDMVPEEDEVTVGAFTIANLNDTDGDSTIDWSDTNVPGEEDMIKVVFKKPEPEGRADALSQEPLGWTPPGSAIPLDISVSGGPSTKLWKSSDKTAGEQTRITIPFAELPLTLWLEGGSASSHLRDTGVFSSFTIGPDSEQENTTYDSAKVTFLDVMTSVSSISQYWPQPGTVEYWTLWSSRLSRFSGGAGDPSAKRTR